MDSAEAHQMTRQSIARDRLARLNGQCATLETAPLAHGQFRPFDSPKGLSGFPIETPGQSPSAQCAARSIQTAWYQGAPPRRRWHGWLRIAPDSAHAPPESHAVVRRRGRIYEAAQVSCRRPFHLDDRSYKSNTSIGTVI